MEILDLVCRTAGDVSVALSSPSFPPAIQRRGCLLIRLLCVPEYLTSLPLCTSVANVIVNALSRWRTEPEVQIEVSISEITELYKND